MTPFSINPAGILLALGAALAWGSGDFSGGRAVGRSSSLHVLAISAFAGLAGLIIATLIAREGLPSANGILWSVWGGMSSAVGMSALYRALSIGPAAIVAPSSAVVGAILPVIYGVLSTGLPPYSRLVGFALALAGIWLVSTGETAGKGSARTSFWLACLAGLGFGSFYIALGLVDSDKIFSPLVIFRCTTLVSAFVLIRATRQPLPKLLLNPMAWLAGALDVGGNLFYVFAKLYTPFEIVAVLGSMYPAVTVMLSAVFLRERVLRAQWVGVGVCLAAVMLITA